MVSLFSSCVSVFLYCLPFFLSVNLSVCLSVCLCVCLSFYFCLSLSLYFIFVCLFVCLSLCLCLFVPVLFLCLYACLCLFVSISLSVCLSVCIFLPPLPSPSLPPSFSFSPSLCCILFYSVVNRSKKSKTAAASGNIYAALHSFCPHPCTYMYTHV